MEVLSPLDWTGIFVDKLPVGYRRINTTSNILCATTKNHSQKEIGIDLPTTKRNNRKTKILKFSIILTATGFMLVAHPFLGEILRSSLHVVHASSSFITHGSTAYAATNHAVSVVTAGTTAAPAGTVTVSTSPDLQGWAMLVRKVLWLVDYLMDGVIIFSGINWMFGNRTKAIELLFGAGVGYIIVRHHDDIRNFFAAL